MAHAETSKRLRAERAVKPAARGKGSGWERFRGFLQKGGLSTNSYVVLLGLETFDSRELIRSVEHGLPYSAFGHLIANTTLSSDDTVTLVNIPQRTLTRRKREGRFHQDESDRLLRASRIFARALSLFEGDREAAKHWLTEPQKGLGLQVPLLLARTEVGALEVERLIGRLEHGVFI